MTSVRSSTRVGFLYGQTLCSLPTALLKSCVFSLVIFCKSGFTSSWEYLTLRSFQPPGIIHLVFTPAASVAFGSHFISFDSMHLTEWTWAIHHVNVDIVTNQILSVCETFHMMMLDIANYSDRSELSFYVSSVILKWCIVFYKRSVAALCLMILSPEEYQARGTEPKKSSHEDLAKAVALIVADKFLGCSGTVKSIAPNEIGHSERML